jgi:hypothetical protein
MRSSDSLREEAERRNWNNMGPQRQGEVQREWNRTPEYLRDRKEPHRWFPEDSSTPVNRRRP